MKTTLYFCNKKCPHIDQTCPLCTCEFLAKKVGFPKVCNASSSLSFFPGLNFQPAPRLLRVDTNQINSPLQSIFLKLSRILKPYQTKKSPPYSRLLPLVASCLGEYRLPKHLQLPRTPGLWVWLEPWQIRGQGSRIKHQGSRIRIRMFTWPPRSPDQRRVEPHWGRFEELRWRRNSCSASASPSATPAKRKIHLIQHCYDSVKCDDHQIGC